MEDRLAKLTQTLDMNVPSTATTPFSEGSAVQNGTAPAGFRPEDLASLKVEYEKEKQDSKKSRGEIEVEKTAWGSEDSLASAQRFFSSAALGWGDEMGLAVAAAINSQVIDPLVSPELNSTFSEEYQRLKTKYDEEQAVFTERQPGAALAADIGGAIASPATYVAAPAAVTAKLGQLAGVGGTAARTGAFGGRAAVEGAVYGAGEAREGERLQGAKEGAVGGLVGAGLTRGATSGVGLAAEVLSKRRVAGDLVDESGNFIPITLAARSGEGVESTIQSLYRDIIAPSFGAKAIIREQENPILEDAEKLLEKHVNWEKQLSSGVKQTEADIDLQFKNAEKAFKDSGKELKKLKKAETETIVVPLKDKLKILKNDKANHIVSKATADVQKITDTKRLSFREKAFLTSFPANTTAQDVTRIFKETDIGARSRALDALWVRKGYNMIKNKTFRFKSGELQKELETALNNDVYFVANVMDMPTVMKTFNNAIDGVDFFKDPNGRVSGEIVSALRSRIGTIANAAVDPQQKRAIYAIQEQLDTIVRKQLTKQQKKEFSEESGNWKSNVILRDSVETTQKDASKRGEFHETDWITAVGKNRKTDNRYGIGTMNREARRLESNLAATDKAKAKQATRLAKREAGAIHQEIKQHTAKLNNALIQIEKNIKAKKAALSARPELAAQLAKDMTERNRIGKEVVELQKNLDVLNQLRSTKSSWFHTLAAVGILGGVVASSLGYISSEDALAIGAGAYGLGKGLTTKSVQRAIAGQTNPQQAVQRMLQSDITGITSDILGRAGGAVGARGMLTE